MSANITDLLNKMKSLTEKPQSRLDGMNTFLKVLRNAGELELFVTLDFAVKW